MLIESRRPGHDIVLGDPKIGPIYNEDVSLDFTRDRLNAPADQYALWPTMKKIDWRKRQKTTTIDIAPIKADFSIIHSPDALNKVLGIPPTNVQSPSISNFGVKNACAYFNYEVPPTEPYSYTGVVQVRLYPDRRYLYLIQALERHGQSADDLRTSITRQHLKLLQRGEWKHEEIIGEILEFNRLIEESRHRAEETV